MLIKQGSWPCLSEARISTISPRGSSNLTLDNERLLNTFTQILEKKKMLETHVFDNSNKVLKHRLPLFVGDDSSCHVPEDVWAARLDGI